jgi:hypothetical protein
MNSNIYLVVDNTNTVVNKIVYNPSYCYPLMEGWQLIKLSTPEVDIGWVYNSDGSFSEPPNKTEEPPNP